MQCLQLPCGLTVGLNIFSVPPMFITFMRSEAGVSWQGLLLWILPRTFRPDLVWQGLLRIQFPPYHLVYVDHSIFPHPIIPWSVSIAHTLLQVFVTISSSPVYISLCTLYGSSAIVIIFCQSIFSSLHYFFAVCSSYVRNTHSCSYGVKFVCSFWFFCTFTGYPHSTES